jgi:hypothetical protein
MADEIAREQQHFRSGGPAVSSHGEPHTQHEEAAIVYVERPAVPDYSERMSGTRGLSTP